MSFVVAQIQSTVPATDTVQTAQSLSMTSTANAVTLAALNGAGGIGVFVNYGTGTGTIVFEGSVDGGTTYFSVPAVPVNGNGTPVTTATASGQWQIDSTGLSHFRVRCSVTGTNSVTVSERASVGSGVSVLGAPLPAGSNVIGAVTANAGTNLNTSALALDATLTGGTATTRVTDGTNTATVKAASTAAVATDKALVVAISPNNTVPVSGTVTANVGTTGGLALDATLTGGTAQSKITDGTTVASVKAASTAAVATDKALVVAVSPNNTVPVSAASLPLPTGAATSAKQPALGTAGTASTDVITVQGIASMTALKVDGSAVTQPVSAASLPLPTGAATETTLAAASAKLPATLGQKTMANSLAVVIASDQSAVPVSGTVTTTSPTSSTATLSNVASSATNVTLLASNGSRKAAFIFNDSTAILYVKMGATASTSSFTDAIYPNEFWQVPPLALYTGQLDGLWASANGNARVTELT